MRRYLIISLVVLLALAWVVPANADEFQLEDDADLIYTEPVHNSLRIGYSVAMGDLNDDGFEDMVVGAPGYYEQDLPGATYYDRGRVYILWGNDDTPDLDDNVDVTIRTDETDQGMPNFHLGFDLAIGDINGDGIDDLLASAPGAQNPLVFSMNAGAVFVFYGDTSWPTEIVLNPYAYTPMLADVNIFGDEYDYNFLGQEIESGDLDNDGFDDIIAAELVAVGYNDGRVNVFFGENFPSGTVLIRHTDVDVEVVHPPEDFGLGNGLAAGDVNDDGIDDLLMGAPGSWYSHVKDKINVTGHIYILFGRSSWMPLVDLTTDGYDVNISGIPNDEANFGFAIAVGDVNGDGVGDVIGGAPNVEAGAPEKAGYWGTVYVVYGDHLTGGGQDIPLDTASNRDITINGAQFPNQASYHLGFALAVGDMDADCIDDILIGGYLREYFQDRVVFMVYGRDNFAPNAVLNMPNDATHSILNSTDPDMDVTMLGNDVAMGDFDHDGLSDMLVGAMGRWGPIDGDNGAAILVLSSENYLPPLADAGDDQKVCGADQLVQLNGTASGGLGITFEWSFVAGPEPVTLSDPNVPNPTFTAPETPGEYIFSLTVYDCNTSDSDEVTITVEDCEGSSDDDADDDHDKPAGDGDDDDDLEIPGQCGGC